MQKGKKATHKEFISLAVGFLGALLGLCGIFAFNRFILMSLPLGVRMAGSILTYWIMALIPVIVMLVCKDKLSDYGFENNKIGYQIAAGVVIGLALSFVLTLTPHLLGFGEYVDNGKRYRYLWQFIYEFVYFIFAVGLAEEFVFRGFIYEKIKRISQKDIVAIIGSSVLFGASHLLGGNLVQMFATAFLGAIFCLCKLKVKNCTTLSLIIAHGIYDALITVWAYVFS